MRILGLETSSLFGSVAAIDTAGGGIALEELSRDGRTAQTLVPGIDRLLKRLGWRADQLDAVAVTIGPGSFTGLRIGVTTAKTLAYAVGARVIGVDTLEALAEAAAGRLAEGEAVWPLIDAHRNQLFTACYRKQAAGGVAAESGVEIVDVDAFLNQPPAEPSWLTGPALRKLAAELRQRRPDMRLFDPDLWTPSAAAVVAIARERAGRGEFDDLLALLPQYYRPSYAEEKRVAAHNND